jgi:pSer/pThr/pTyr-binding forkhead associated (FHA) protein
MTSAKLKIAYTDGRTEERELSAGTYRVGRENADLVIAHASVSAHHANLEVQASRVVISDVGSRNGTYAPGGQRLSAEYTLVPEQPIRVGAISVTLLRGKGQAGGTRVMQEPPRAGRTRVMSEAQHVAATPALPMLATPSVGPPTISRWIKVIGVFAILLLGFVSVKTCTALVQAVGGGQ